MFGNGAAIPGKPHERRRMKRTNPREMFLAGSCNIHMAPRVGFEPTTYRLTAECSAVELPRNEMVGVTRFELVTPSV